MSLDLIRPDIFLQKKDIESYFTLANRESVRPNNAIVNGLHLGAFGNERDLSVKKNYSLLFNTIGWDQEQLAIAKQVHGSQVNTVRTPGICNDCDGIVTDQVGLAIGIQVADCAAILLYEPEARIIAALHAGWRGAISGIVSEGIKSIMKLDGDPSKLTAFISPCISLLNFEVGHEVASLFPKQYCDFSSYEKPHVDLSGFLKNQLEIEGLKAVNIESSDICTFTNENYFSYRREKEKSGRMLGLIKMNK